VVGEHHPENRPGKSGNLSKNNVPVISGADGAALREIRLEAKRKNARLIAASTCRDSLGRYELALKGEHQKRNTKVVLCAVDQLRSMGFRIPAKAVIRGLEAVQWPGRFEVFSC